MKLSLLINEKEQTFTAPFISARRFREALQLNKKLTGEIDVETLDELVDYVVACYGNQFTADEFYDGTLGPDLVSTVMEVINTVTGSVAPQGGKEADFLKK